MRSVVFYSLYCIDLILILKLQLTHDLHANVQTPKASRYALFILMDRQLNQPTASTSQNTHKKKRQHVSLPNTNPVAGSSSGRTLADNIPNSSRGPLPALGLGLSDSTSAAQNSPPRLRHKRPMPNFRISASNNAGPSAVAGPSKVNGKKKEHQPRQFVAAKASSSKQRAAVHGDGDRGLTGSGMVAAHDTEDDTVTGAESMNDTMTSSSGYAGITGELKKMRKELETLKKVRSSIVLKNLLLTSLPGLAHSKCHRDLEQQTNRRRCAWFSLWS